MSREQHLNPKKLLERLEYYEENRRFTQNALERTLSLGDWQHNISNGYGPHQILKETEKRAHKLMPFEAIALYLVDQDKADFNLSVCKPNRLKQLIDDEVGNLIDKGSFAWAMREKRGLFVPSKDRFRRFLLHVIATNSRIRGMFVGLLSDQQKKVPDTAITLLSILLLNTANALESYEFYAFMRNQNMILQKRIKERTKELARSEKQLQQVDKLQAIGTLAGGIAHDFNNILFPIIGYTQMAIEDVSENSQIRTNLEEVLKATHRAKDLVKQILAFSRQSSQEYRPLRLQTLIKEALKLLRASIPTTIEIVHNVDGTCGTTIGDPTQIHQVIMNLCTNAFHAMQETGGKLKIDLTEVDIGVDDVLAKMGMKPRRYLQLEVIDTGHGMDPAVLERIFEPYFTTKDQGKGTGLGLSVAHGIVKSHGGDIRIYSKPGKGTTFRVYLPLFNNIATEYESIIEETAARGTEHLLLVDDEEQIVKLEQQVLQRLGYHVTIRTSSLDALETFRKQPQKYDLVITDMTMPNMTGIELAPELMHIRSDVPVILCSGFSEMITEERAKAIGVREYVQKPVAISVLAKTIRKVLDKKQT
jgi:signal transduction histidine kinase/ActR/RegA family two-component response regulator